ncbi:hypothetical protein D9M70_253160 [compost metagenome]
MMTTNAVMTKTHRKYFLAFVQDAIRGAYAGSVPAEKLEEFLSQVDLQPAADQIGQAILSKVSYSQVKAVDKFMKSDDYISVIGAIQYALAEFVLPSPTGGENE